ncbi:hypothetical protein RZS08_32275, partial [Arthrospira platensis SPKY1]|nr:hypothetical protein [Arthrospira platensis SPKY1]
APVRPDAGRALRVPGRRAARTGCSKPGVTKFSGRARRCLFRARPPPGGDLLRLDGGGDLRQQEAARLLTETHVRGSPGATARRRSAPARGGDSGVTAAEW